MSPAPDLLVALCPEWYQHGGEVSERQWSDVLGILRALEALDLPYLETGARELGVEDLLARAVKTSEADRPGRGSE